MLVLDAGAYERANRSAAELWARDRASQSLGMSLEAVAPGRATLTMVVREDMLNGHGTCHGGIITTFADSAFAMACNTYNVATVAQSISITFLVPVSAGERLVAEAVEISREGRTGIYDVSISGVAGRVVAQFRGQSRSMAGSIFDESAQ